MNRFGPKPRCAVSVPGTTVTKFVGSVSDYLGSVVRGTVLRIEPGCLDFRLWLHPDIPRDGPERPLLPRKPTFRTRLGMSQVDPKRAWGIVSETAYPVD